MTDIRIVEMNELDDSMITIDEITKIVGLNKLTVQKKIQQAKLESIAMLKSGKRGRPARIFKRSEVNALFDIPTVAAISNTEIVSSNNENDQNRDLAQEGVSPSP
jgi:predicted ArsR family transcriptional regulator